MANMRKKNLSGNIPIILSLVVLFVFVVYFSREFKTETKHVELELPLENFLSNGIEKTN